MVYTFFKILIIRIFRLNIIQILKLLQECCSASVRKFVSRFFKQINRITDMSCLFKKRESYLIEVGRCSSETIPDLKNENTARINTGLKRKFLYLPV